MAARSELSHRVRELKLAAMGRLVPRVLSKKTSGVDGVVKKVVAKGAGEPDTTVDPDLLHPDDVPEIVTQASPVDGGAA